MSQNWTAPNHLIIAALDQDEAHEPEFTLTPLQRSWLIEQGKPATLEGWLEAQGYLPHGDGTSRAQHRARALDERMIRHAPAEAPPPRDPTMHVLTGGAV